MPEVSRSQAPYLQIAAWYADRIARGEVASGERLPPLRDIADEWGVSQGTAQRAMDHLKSSRLVSVTHEGGHRGHVVNGVTVRLTPAERLAAVQSGGPLHLRTEVAEVTSAGLVAAAGDWEYVAGLLGVPAGSEVARREQVFREPDGSPAMLAVSWFPPDLAEAVPELLNHVPFTGTGEIGLITERTGRRVARSDESWEARGVKGDGREDVLLGLAAGSPCLAGVYVWSDETDVLEYGEFVQPPGRVIRYRHDVSAER